MPRFTFALEVELLVLQDTASVEMKRELLPNEVRSVKIDEKKIWSEFVSKDVQLPEINPSQATNPSKRFAFFRTRINLKLPVTSRYIWWTLRDGMIDSESMRYCWWKKPGKPGKADSFIPPCMYYHHWWLFTLNPTRIRSLLKLECSQKECLRIIMTVCFLNYPASLVRIILYRMLGVAKAL